MNKNIILQQKAERDIFLSRAYIPRAQLNSMKSLLENKMIKVITGPRRAGKSILAILSLQGTNFAYLNFDDDNLLKVESLDEIVSGLKDVYGDVQYYFFDEIQNLKNWELFVNKLHRRGYNLILTGSNANLLSKELGSVLTGRYLSQIVLPFSFKEYLVSEKVDFITNTDFIPEQKGIMQHKLDKYLRMGGFPDIVVNDISPDIYLDSLWSAVILKDIVQRYSIRDTDRIRELSAYLISLYTSEFSYSKLKNILGFNSKTTLQKYLYYLEESYLFFVLNRFSYKQKEQIKTPRKIFVVDNGLVVQKDIRSSEDSGKLLENAVFLELLRRGYKANQSLFYYKTRNMKEVDFITRKGIKIERLYQVTYRLDVHNEERECNALVEAAGELDCKDLVVITWNREEVLNYKGLDIKLIPAWKFFIEKRF